MKSDKERELELRMIEYRRNLVDLTCSFAVALGGQGDTATRALVREATEMAHTAMFDIIEYTDMRFEEE